MGAKYLPNVEDKNLSTCHICLASFATPRLLKSHILTKHPSNSDCRQQTEKNDAKKTALVPPTSRVSKRLQDQKKSDEKTEKMVKKIESSVNTPDSKKPVFECPKCLKQFPVFFSALKHIEKRHTNLDGNDAEDLKPVKVEFCADCNERITEDKHNCPKLNKIPSKIHGGEYTCLGCEKIFTSIDGFDQHIVRDHDMNIDITIFQGFDEFMQWKTAMENQVRVKYLPLYKTNDKQYYQCNFVSPKNSAQMTRLCPSTVIAQQTKNSVTVHYYKTHYGHYCSEYKVPRNSSPSISQSKDDPFDSLLTNENDVHYSKFKELMENIVDRAEKLDDCSVKKLHNLALNMKKVMNELLNGMKNDTDDDDNDNREEMASDAEEQGKVLESSVSKSMTDDQISKVLEVPKSSRASERLKRKTESTPIETKKKKVFNEVKKDLNDSKDKEVKYLNEQKLANKHSSITNTSLKTNNSMQSMSSPIRPLVISPSFNDSYKEFIGTAGGKLTGNMQKKQNKTLPKSPSASTSAKKSGQRKEIVKTKIGQFIPSPERKQRENLENTIKKEKIPSPQKCIKDLNLDVMDYEVVEQENDCNILVLKI